MTFSTAPTPDPADPARPADAVPLDSAPPTDHWDIDEDDEPAIPQAPADDHQPPAPGPLPAPAGIPASAAVPTSRGEKIALGLLALLLLLVAVWVVRMLAAHVPTMNSAELGANYPHAGTHATLAGVQTHWRAPVSSGPNKDRFRQGALLLPVARITLAQRSGSGALRVFFRDSNGEIVGDPTTVAFADGRFATTNSEVIEIVATDGFRQEGLHAAYVAGQGGAWMLEMREAATVDAGAGAFTVLLETPISPQRR